jgi:hypothetical protein
MLTGRTKTEKVSESEMVYLVVKFPTFMEPEVNSPNSQEFAISSYAELDEYNPYPPTLFV